MAPTWAGPGLFQHPATLYQKLLISEALASIDDFSAGIGNK